MTTPGVVAIGTSWGGLSALGRILSSLPGDFRSPIIVVQHRSKDSDNLLAKLLQDISDLKIHEAEDKDTLLPSHVYVAPADYHLLVDAGEVSLTVDAPFRYSRPSIDVAFESVARSFGSAAIGVVLTGANDDGARGLARIIALGGQGIVEDPKTAEMPVMPEAAKRASPSAEVLPLQDIPARLVRMVNAPGQMKRKAG
ncbi:MAG: chemotaxis protein CheB [Gemmatimonadaceae bacterium]|nr:chemotaxis protein CheB [Gemmatimonadaceae bacterium]